METRVQAQVLPTHTPALFAAAVARAAERLKAGDVVALPTETVYGLAANALDARAVARLFAIKGRPAHNPIIVHVAGPDMIGRCVSEWPEAARRLAAAFWPGPLTVVLPRTAAIPDLVTAGGGTVGLRWPSHPFIQAVILACDFPLAAPSANLSSRLSPTTAEHVRKSLGGRVGWIVDGGPSQVGIESTVIDLTARPARILRPGMIHTESLCAVIGRVDGGTGAEAASPLRSPGLLTRHYSPRARLEVWNWGNDAELSRRLGQCGADREPVWLIVHTGIPVGLPGVEVSLVPRDPEAYARALYAELHRCDQAGAGLIVVEAPPDEPRWQAVADRLRRAAAG